MKSHKHHHLCDIEEDRASEYISDAFLGNMIVSEYYDGPVSGFLRCSDCSCVYYFTTVAWSRNSFIRAIALGAVPIESWPQLIDFFGEAPFGPQWIPTALSRPTEQEIDRIEAFLDKIIAQAKPTSLLIAWDVTLNKCLSVRRAEGLPSPALLNIFNPLWPGFKKAGDWFIDLGLAIDV